MSNKLYLKEEMFNNLQVEIYRRPILKFTCSRYNRLLSIEASSKVCGFAVYENGSIQDFGRIYFPVEYLQLKPYAKDRIGEITDALIYLIEKYNPGTVVVENPYMPRKNTKNKCDINTYNAIAPIRDNLWYYCRNNCLDYHVMTSKRWQSFITEIKVPRERDDIKAWSIECIEIIFGINLDIHLHDISDAILLGLAYRRQRERNSSEKW